MELIVQAHGLRGRNIHPRLQRETVGHELPGADIPVVVSRREFANPQGAIRLREVGFRPCATQRCARRNQHGQPFAQRLEVVNAAAAQLICHRLQLAQRSDGRCGHLLVAQEFLSAGKPLSSATAAALQRHPWPGNVRELRNVIQRAELLATGNRIDVADLNLPRAPAAPRPAPGAGNDPDRARIEAVLARHHGVIAQAAAELGLSRQALYRRMDRHGIPRE